MTIPQNPVSTDEVLCALLARGANNTDAVSLEEIRAVRRDPGTLVLTYDGDRESYVIRVDRETPAQQLREQGGEDMRPVGPGANF